MLHSYINQCYEFPWPNYCDSPLFSKSRKISQTLELLYHHTKCPKIVLLVDEFLHLFGGKITDDLHEVLERIHKVKDSILKNSKVPFDFFTCVTSLAYINKDETQVSSRPIHWHKLPRFDSKLYLLKGLGEKPLCTPTI